MQKANNTEDIYLYEIMQRIQQHMADEDALRKLYAALAGELCSFALIYLKDEAAASEIVNDVFLKLWYKRHELREIKNVKSYLFRAVKNTALNRLEVKGHQHWEFLEQADSSHLEFSPDPELLLITEEMRRMVEKEVNALPGRCKIIFKLIREEGLKYQEVADILDISVKTVEAQMLIATKRIGSLLQLSTRPR